LINAFSPGPLTYLLKKKSIIPDITTAGSEYVAVRIPQHPLTLKLLAQLSFPLAAPSANPSGYVSPVTAQHVFEGLHGKIPYILDGGNAIVGLESTIIGFKDGDVVVHRLGGLPIEELEGVLGKSVRISITHDAPETPGQLKSHYATRKKMIIGDMQEIMKEYGHLNVGIISFQQQYDVSHPHMILSTKGDMAEAASRLFSAMREMDEKNVDVILAELVPDVGIGKAINDRLKRASH
jgi:L-threonylcarbamoyladenylate synthase